jgi:SAM-dependent methyltransferase/uncharacterized protein YbaR (Trm112 family)
MPGAPIISSTNTVSIPDLILEHRDLFACPNCRASLRLDGSDLVCHQCGASYRISEEGIPLLFCPTEGWTDGRDVTRIVKQFYHVNPLPNYDDLNSRDNLSEKINKGIVARLLDEHIPVGSLVLQVGCGTGQLANFLGLSWKRKVFGADLCLNSLRLAAGFRDRFSVNHAAFLQMNLFRPAFRERIFDVVICNGVLDHTADPVKGLRSLATLVKPGGIIVIGLYNRIGRLRQMFADKYKRPYESKHSFSETIQWIESSGFEFLMTIPKISSEPLSPDEKPFEPHSKGTSITRFLAEVEMLLKGGVDAGQFIVIGRKIVSDHGMKIE